MCVALPFHLTTLDVRELLHQSQHHQISKKLYSFGKSHSTTEISRQAKQDLHSTKGLFNLLKLAN